MSNGNGGLLDPAPALTDSSAMDVLDRITIDPARRSGKPCIRETRIAVQDVLDYLASGMSEREIIKDFPELEPEDIRASLAFAAARERRLFGAA
jgi:uncharacterized protein (DUF433 family)